VPLLEKSHSLLEDDAIFLMRAGTDAPSHTIAMTMFHILNNPTTYQRLKEELFAAIPDVTVTPNMDQLEQIPYLVCDGVIPYFSSHIGLILA
jgi:cytochrome P450